MMIKHWTKVAVLWMLVGALALSAACGDGENGDPDDPDAPGDLQGNDSMGNDSIPETHFFDEDEWYLYISEMDGEAQVNTRSWGYDDDGTRGAQGTGTYTGDQGRSFGTGRSTEEWPNMAVAAWLTEGDGPATLVLYEGHERVDEITLSEVGDRMILVGGQVVADIRTDPVSVSGDADPGEFIASFSGLGHHLDLQGETSFGPGSNTLQMDVKSATVDDSSVDASGLLRIGWNGDLAEGTYSSEDEDDDSGLRIHGGSISWGEFPRETIEIDHCEVIMEVTTPCDFDNNCVGEATVTNCRADKKDLDDTFPITVGFADAVFHFNPVLP